MWPTSSVMPLGTDGWGAWQLTALPMLTNHAVLQDFFFYSLVYDPQQKTLLADKGEIRVGSRYQADITDLLEEGR